MFNLNDADKQYNSDVFGFTEDLTEENFYVPAEAEYEDFGEEVEEYDAASLWENIARRKSAKAKTISLQRRVIKTAHLKKLGIALSQNQLKSKRKLSIKTKMVRLAGRF